jgi:hypothetical protein
VLPNQKEQLSCDVTVIEARRLQNDKATAHELRGLTGEVQALELFRRDQVGVALSPHDCSVASAAHFCNLVLHSSFSWTAGLLG